MTQGLLVWPMSCALTLAAGVAVAQTAQVGVDSKAQGANKLRLLN